MPDLSQSGAWTERFELKADELRTLPQDWDSYGGVAATAEAIEAARRFLEVALAKWSLVPLADGGVQLEWHANGIEVEITFDPKGEQTYE